MTIGMGLALKLSYLERQIKSTIAIGRIFVFTLQDT